MSGTKSFTLTNGRVGLSANVQFSYSTNMGHLANLPSGQTRLTSHAGYTAQVNIGNSTQGFRLLSTQGSQVELTNQGSVSR